MQICAYGINIKEIYCDLDTAFKSKIVSTLLNTLGITVKFFSVLSHQSNPAEHAIQSVSSILINYIAKYDKYSHILFVHFSNKSFAES